jgi:ribosomal protein S18 acetylase RimI-like enzyme
MESMEIRETSDPAALTQVLAILKAAFALHDGRIDPPSGARRETVESLTEKLRFETLLVACEDTTVLGSVWCKHDGSDVYIGRLAVNPAHHSEGIGQQLIDAATAWARSHGAKTMSLGVRLELTENIRLFERNGFRITAEDRHPGYDRPTSYQMEREL